MPNGQHSDDSIEPATPPRQRLQDVSSSTPRIICLDSSPIIPSPARQASAHTSIMSEHSFRSAMNSGNGSSMSRTTFTSPTKQNSNGHHHTSSSKNNASNGAKSFRSSLEQFRYGGSSNPKRHVADSDKSSDLSDPESSEEDRKPKKRRLVRGGGAAARSRSRDSSGEPPVKKQPVDLPVKHIVVQDDDDDNDNSVQEIPRPAPRQSSSTPAPTSTISASSALPVPLSDDELREKARLIIKKNPFFRA